MKRHGRPGPGLGRLWTEGWPALRRPLFVVGAPRSGTTFLGRCVGALPGVALFQEPAATKRVAGYVYGQQWAEPAAARYYHAVYRGLLALRGGGRFAEKTPRNCFLLPFLLRTFPDAQVVHIIRDGRDAALSHSKKPWMQPADASGRAQGFGTYARFWIEPDRADAFEQTTTFHRCIWNWRRHVEAALEARDHLAGNQYHEIRYEALVQQPRAEGRRLLAFLDHDRPAARMAWDDAVADVKTSSVGRHRELTPEQQRTTEAEAGTLLRQLGYLP